MPEVRPLVVRSLQKTGLNKPAHRLYYRYIHGFDTPNPAVLPALEVSFETAMDRVEKRLSTASRPMG